MRVGLILEDLRQHLTVLRIRVGIVDPIFKIRNYEKSLISELFFSKFLQTQNLNNINIGKEQQKIFFWNSSAFIIYHIYCKQGNLERGVIQNNIYFEFLVIYFEPIFKKTVEFSKKICVRPQHYSRKSHNSWTSFIKYKRKSHHVGTLISKLSTYHKHWWLGGAVAGNFWK